MISMASLCQAIRHSLELTAEQERIEREQLAAKRAAQERTERLWSQEQERRRVADLDEDGSRAAARAALQERQEEARLAEMTAMILRQTRR